ncbi:MAG: hypothetical protein RIE24_19550 [Silicimonas sp.]
MTIASNDRVGVVGGEAVLVVAGFLALAAANLVFWRFDYPPLIDMPNHLARHALQCASEPAAGLGQYYEYTFSWVPNLTAELVYALPLACQSLLTTQKILIQFATTGLLAAVIVLHAAVWRRWSVWPLLAAFGTHHMAFGYGFENFVLAAPPVLLGLAPWFLLRDRRAVVRLLPMVPVAGAIYVLHLYAFVFMIGTIGLLELQKWWAERKARDFLTVGALMTLVAAGPVLHLMMVAIGTDGVDAGQTDFGPAIRRLTVVLSPFTPLGVPYLDSGVLRVASFQLVALCAIWMVVRFRRWTLVLSPGSRLALGGMFILTIAMPGTLGAVHLSDIRFPVLLLCLAISVSDVRLSRTAALCLVLAILAAGLWRTHWLEGRWATHDREVRELLALESVLTDRDRLLVARTGHPWDVLLHSHSASHLAREVGLFLPDLFTGGNSLSARGTYRLRDNFQPYPVPASRLIEEYHEPRGPDPDAVPYAELYWTDWQSFYTHVLVLGRPGASFPDVKEFGRTVRRGTFFALYETGFSPE